MGCVYGTPVRNSTDYTLLSESKKQIKMTKLLEIRFPLTMEGKY